MGRPGALMLHRSNDRRRAARCRRRPGACARGPGRGSSVSGLPRASTSSRARRSRHSRSGPTMRRGLRARHRARRCGSAGPGNPSRRESADGRAAGRDAGRARCSKRGCSDQISLIVASKRRGIAIFFACSASTASMASNSAGMDLPPPARAAFHVARTSCHRSVANRKPGDTPRSSRTRRSVSARASSIKRWPSGCSRITSISGRRPCDRPCARRLRSVSTAWPDSRSFCISSKSRAAGTFWISGASFGIGAAVFGLIATLSFAASLHGPQHPNRILAQAGRGGADQPQLARADVGHAADVVPHLFLGRDRNTAR